MSDNDNKKKLDIIEIFKATSTFISSVIIALTGIYVTYKYNSRQLEISQRQADSQIVIARNKELSDLIPKLGSPDANIRRFSAITLSLYGKDAIPALIATFNDEDPNTRTAASESVNLIGPIAIPDLTKAFQNQRNDVNLRAVALFTLGRMRAQNAFELAISALENPREDPIVRKDAVAVLGFLKEDRVVEKLISLLKKSKEGDIILTQNILWALGEIQTVPITDEIISLLEHPDEEVRYHTVWTLGKIGGEKALNILSQVVSKDKSERVRKSAKDAYFWAKRLE